MGRTAISTADQSAAKRIPSARRRRKASLSSFPFLEDNFAIVLPVVAIIAVVVVSALTLLYDKHNMGHWWAHPLSTTPGIAR